MSLFSVLKGSCLAGLTVIAIPVFRPTEPSQSLQQVATLQTARSVHTATTLQSGLVLVVGGMADGGSSIA
jgi:hypothetical protein